MLSCLCICCSDEPGAASKEKEALEKEIKE